MRRWPSAGAGAWAGGKGGRGGCVTLTQVGAVQPVHQPVLRARLQARARATGRCSVAPVPPQVVHRFSEWRDLNRRLGAVLAASEHGGRAAAAPLPHFPARLPFGGASVVARRQCASPPLRCPGPRPSHTPRPAASPAVLNAPRPQGPPNQAAASSAAPRAKPSAQPGPASRSPPPPPATSSRRPADQVAHWHALRRRRRAPERARCCSLSFAARTCTGCTPRNRAPRTGPRPRWKRWRWRCAAGPLALLAHRRRLAPSPSATPKPCEPCPCPRACPPPNPRQAPVRDASSGLTSVSAVRTCTPTRPTAAPPQPLLTDAQPRCACCTPPPQHPTPTPSHPPPPTPHPHTVSHPSHLSPGARRERRGAGPCPRRDGRLGCARRARYAREPSELRLHRAAAQQDDAPRARALAVPRAGRRGPARPPWQGRLGKPEPQRALCSPWMEPQGLGG